MRLVRQKEKYVVKRRRTGLRGPGRTAAGRRRLRTAPTVRDSGAAGRRKPVRRAGGGGRLRQAPAAAEAKAARLNARSSAARVAVAAKKWGLAKIPLVAPAPPAVKPRITTRDGLRGRGRRDLPPVFTTVPTKERVVFLTIDDGAEKDPELLRMMTELKIPYSAFLSDYLVSDGLRLLPRHAGAGRHPQQPHPQPPYLPGLSYEEQRQEICGEQDKLEKQYGKRPRPLPPAVRQLQRRTPCARQVLRHRGRAPVERRGVPRPHGVARMGPGPAPGRHRAHPLPGDGEWEGSWPTWSAAS